MTPALPDSASAPAAAYALFMAAGGAMLAAWGLRDAPRHGVSREHVLALFLLSWLAGWAGARVWFVIEHRELLREPLWRWILHPSPGGFSSYGGLLSGLATAGVYARSTKLPLRKLADTAAPGLCFFGIAARLGCFFAGCCYGRPTALPWAVSAAPGTLAARRFGDLAALHPVQLYEAAAVALIGWLAAARSASFAGATFLRVAASYSVARLFVDALRGDAHLIAGGLSSNQWVSLVILALSAGLAWAARRDLCLSRAPLSRS